MFFSLGKRHPPTAEKCTLHLGKDCPTLKAQVLELYRVNRLAEAP